jgi:hypothetical protein
MTSAVLSFSNPYARRYRMLVPKPTSASVRRRSHMDRLARADFFIRNEQFLLDYAAMGQLVLGHMDDEGADPELGKVLLELNAAADGQENIKLVLGDVRSAKAASGGTKRKRNSADLAAGSESVLREFLKRGPSSNVSQPCA